MSYNEKIVNWIKDYAERYNKKTLVVGISGGIDSAVVSTLCAKTGIDTIVLSLPLHQKQQLHDLSIAHGSWLTSRFKNVCHRTIDLTPSYDQFVSIFKDTEKSLLSLANTKSRLRMVALYQVASNHNGLVVGTGNKVEDFGVGFFTKYGDGGVDISPIADLLKTDVWNAARELDIISEIINAPPTDGLWEDDRTDEQQLGTSYENLEWAMKNAHNLDKLEGNERKTVEIYLKHHNANLHKMLPIPICNLRD